MMQNKIVSREEWLTARTELLAREKALTKARAELAEGRRAMPWVQIEKPYVLENEEGVVTLADAFEECRQLVIYHIMFGEGWESVCVGCTQWANAMNGTTDYFSKANARLIAVSRAPIDQIVAMREQLGWQFPWYSVHNTTLNEDMYMSSNHKDGDSKVVVGEEVVTFDRGENHGVTVFIKGEDGAVYHTYTVFNRGVEEMNGAFGYFDLLPLGRPW